VSGQLLVASSKQFKTKRDISHWEFIKIGQTTMKDPFSEGQPPLFIPHSHTSTAVNKTGSWRFFHPKYDGKTAPCSAACPLGQDIARIEMLASWGLFKDAWQLIMNENPFPAVCGRVCFHPCENACNRGQLDSPIAIHVLERFIGDIALSKNRCPKPVIKATRNKSVAIVGAGPAGLSAAYFLARLGYQCEVFEAAPAPGGLLCYGIPPYRLPHDILDLEIKRIESQGVTIHCEKPVAADLLKEIKDKFDALFIGCGYGRSIRLNIEGHHLARDGLEFLSRINEADISFDAGRSVVFGGGNTAIDVARCLVRLGSSPLIIYRRRIQDMPAFAPEVETALQEGVEIMELAEPIGIRPNQGKSSESGCRCTLTLQAMKISKVAFSGRPHVIPDGAKTKTMDAQHIFSAIGAVPDDLWHFSATDQDRPLTLSHCKFMEQEIPVVIGGDLASPVKSVADAIASGKQAAMALDTYFEIGRAAVGDALAACRVGTGPALSMDAYLGRNRRERNTHVVAYDEIITDYFQTGPRVSPSILDVSRRICSFAEVESTLTNAMAKTEAERCFNCGSCNACDYCRLYCPEMAVKVEKGQRSIDMDYCKGCGVCATECPRNAMALEEETK
jgi:NADPH-dependent glutamate synthase beta subunit-like oxidoreductase/ferredoxin